MGSRIRREWRVSMFTISRRHAIGLLGSAAFMSGTAAAKTKAGKSDVAFEKIARNWLNDSLRLSPISATGIGEHRWDGEVDDVSVHGRDKQRALYKKTLASLNAINRSKLSRAN